MEFVDGGLVFECPPQMKRGEATVVRLRISEGALREIVLKNLDPKILWQARIQVGAFMQVVLVGGSAFEIIERRSARQSLIGLPYQEWTWDVIPKESGRHPLSYRVVAFATSQGFGEHNKDVGFETKHIDVTFNLGYWLKQVIERKASDWTLYIVFGIVGAVTLRLKQRFWPKLRALLARAHARGKTQEPTDGIF